MSHFAKFDICFFIFAIIFYSCFVLTSSTSSGKRVHHHNHGRHQRGEFSEKSEFQNNNTTKLVSPDWKDTTKSLPEIIFDYLLPSTSTPLRNVYLNRMLPVLFNYFQQKQFSTAVDTRDGGQYVNLQEPGGIAFPSLEGALLSLAFLTFAVFLVDLVQQVISRIRTGTGVPLLGRRKRSLERAPYSDDTIFSTMASNVITAIENPLFAFNEY